MHLKLRLVFWSFRSRFEGQKTTNFLSFCSRKSVPFTIKRTEIVVLIVFSMLVHTFDNYSDLRVSTLFLTGTYTPAFDSTSSGKIITPVPQYKYAIFSFLPVFISFLFTLKHWWSK